MFNGNDAGDPTMTQSGSDAALPRRTRRSDGKRSSAAVEANKAREAKLAEEKAYWASLAGPVTVRPITEDDRIDFLARKLCKADGKVFWTDTIPAAYRQRAREILAEEKAD